MRLSHASRLIARNTVHLRMYSEAYQDAKLRQIIETSNMAPKKRQLAEDKKKYTPVINKDSTIATDQGPFIDITAAKSETRGGQGAAAGVSTNTDAAADANPRPPINSEPNSPSEATVRRASPLAGIFQFAESQTAEFRRWKETEKAKLAAALPRLAAFINSVTGYDQIEMHKNLVAQVEQQMEEARAQVRYQKREYEEAIERRSSSQKEINELLTRKHEWTPRDVERFTELYKNDHVNQQKENSGKTQLAEAENRFESLQVQLTSTILTRYHEEQLWSDKIRGASTWGTWMLMGLNIALFAVATFFVEPWKRKRLVTAFEAEMAAKLSEFSDEIHNLSVSIEKKTASTTVQAWAKSDIRSALSLRMSQLKAWAAASIEKIRAWMHHTYSQLCQSPNFRFLQSKADLSIFSSFLVFFGWSLSRLRI